MQLSKEEIMSMLRTRMGEERSAIVRVIALLVEVDKRGLYADDAYSSLQDFCVRFLHMSEDAAYRRATAARLARRFPLVLSMLESGAIQLSGLCLLRNYLDHGNVERVLNEVAGKTKRQIENYLAARRPRPDVSSSMADETGDTELAAPKVEPLSADRVHFSFSGSAKLRAMVEQVQSLMRHTNPTGDLGEIFERSIALLLEELERKVLKKTDAPKPAPERVEDSRSIPDAIRRQVFERDGVGCTFEDENGNRCNSRDFIEVDHINPRAKGGGNTLDNLRVLCRTHNAHAAVKAFGQEHIDRQIERSREIRARKDEEPAATD